MIGGRWMVLFLVLLEETSSSRRLTARRRRKGERRRSRRSKRRRILSSDDDIFVNGYEDKTDYRTNLCNLSTQITNGDVDYSDALSGMTLKFIAYYKASDPYAIDYDDEDGFSGWHYEVLDEIAELANFDYELKLLNSSSPTNKSYFDKIMYNMNHYDASLHSTTYTSDRAALGMLQPFSYVDESAWLVTKTSDSETKNAFKNRNQFFKFAQPFSYKLWIITVATTIATGIAYFVLEHQSAYSDAETMTEAMHLSLLQITQSGGFSPVTYGGKLLVLSWGMVVLIIISSYTANLAAFLVNHSDSNAEYDSITDVVSAGGTVCVHTGYASQDVLDSNYPSVKQYDTVTEFSDFYHGKCNALVTERAQYDVALESSVVYPSCSFERVGEALDSSGAGWAIKGDYSSKCSSLLSQLLTQYFLELDLDGTISGLYDEYLEDWKDKSCDSTDDTSTDSDTGDEDALGVKEMTGVFVLHGCAVLLALCIHFGLGWRRKIWFHPHNPPDRYLKSKRRTTKSSPSSKRNVTAKDQKEISSQDNHRAGPQPRRRLSSMSMKIIAAATASPTDDLLTTPEGERPAPYLARSKETAHMTQDISNIDRHVFEMQARLDNLDSKFNLLFRQFGIEDNESTPERSSSLLSQQEDALSEEAVVDIDVDESYFQQESPRTRRRSTRAGALSAVRLQVPAAATKKTHEASTNEGIELRALV